MITSTKIKGFGPVKDFEWEKTGKPLMFTEYGADTVMGLHDTTPVMYTEEYQVEYETRCGNPVRQTLLDIPARPVGESRVIGQ